ncbi:restriction endonuclease fold toxin-2 domain-containing protein [Kribbella sp. NPDC000426]|uniref:restriction endonuclease fold toxin-2 domain-containing protein n=1 Tax=Kribbella sp. NPDC000426 TaxID=3154255 RepID=UPI00331BFBB1
MPSELQRVARGLVDCFDEIPRVVEQLQRTAVRCRENAQLALIASRGQATVAAQQLDAAARACEAAAHYLSMAPPKARGWAEGLVGTAGPSTNRPSSDSADRNKLTSGSGDLDSLGRTKRLSYEYEDLEVAEDNEPPLITVARKAFEKYRKSHEKDDEEERDAEPLEVEIRITETGEIEFEERDEKQDKKRNEHLLEDFQIEVDLTEAVKALLASMATTADQQWQHANLTITTDETTATFDYPEEDRPQPIVVNVELPDLPDRQPGAEPAEPVDVELQDVELQEVELGGDFGDYTQRLIEVGRVRPIVGSGPEMEFQREHCGPVEFRLTVDERLPRAVWADGLDAVLRRAQDAKYVAPTSGSSFYRPSSLPPFLRQIAEEKNDHMLLKYREVIEDRSNPVEGLEIITNDHDAAAYFQDRMRALDISGNVTLKPEDDS